jgi:hypothetical protein
MDNNLDMDIFVRKCSDHTIRSIFPNDVRYRPLVITINLLHIFGVLVIQFGILLPPKMMKYYIIYLVLLLVSYIILNNRCFMTELSNYIGGKNYNSLCIKLSQAKMILVFYLVLAILFELNPDYSFYSLLSTMAKKNL